ncbi:MAG TPA: aspartyl protease family protein [Candidatus Angelobacter sp.]|jgi:predicted aspartyl protease
MISIARVKALEAAGKPHPEAQKVRALIDTGASITGVDPTVLKALGISQTGEAEIHTPSTGGTPVKVPTYDVTIGIYEGRPGQGHFISDTIQVTETDLSRHGFQVLIGTDVLAKCLFHYNGAEGFFTLCY